MGSTGRREEANASPERGRTSPEARAARHASRAGATYARFIRNVADAGGYAIANAERYTAGVIATLEERLPIREVRDLEAQLPSRLDDILAFEPLVAMPRMDGDQFRARVASRLDVTDAEADCIARVVFRVLRSRISVGEARRIEARLPEDMRELWRQPGEELG
jgi:uncharacterized protein (DUF2267 family)